MVNYIIYSEPKVFRFFSTVFNKYVSRKVTLVIPTTW